MSSVQKDHRWLLRQLFNFLLFLLAAFLLFLLVAVVWEALIPELLWGPPEIVKMSFPSIVILFFGIWLLFRKIVLKKTLSNNILAAYFIYIAAVVMDRLLIWKNINPFPTMAYEQAQPYYLYLNLQYLFWLGLAVVMLFKLARKLMK